MWKTLQCEGKNHGHQSATTFTIFVECLQERHNQFWPKPPGDGPPLHSSTWPPSRNLDLLENYNSISHRGCRATSCVSIGLDS
jgi:hypothetical protein